MTATAILDDDKPPQYPRGQCTSGTCQAPIVWAVLPNGDKLPVDAEPVDINRGGGDILLTQDGTIIRARRVTNPAQLFGKRWVYRSHFDTCPQAGQWRRRRSSR